MIIIRNFCFCILFLFSHYSYSQIDLLENVISVTAINQPASFVLTQITKQTNALFSYSPDQININQIVNIELRKRTVRDILDIMFKDKIRFKSNSTHIILLKKKEDSETNKIYITGYVTNSVTGDKISEVSIYENLSLASAITNINGYYELKLPLKPGEVILYVNKNQYFRERNYVNIAKNRKINISLIPLNLDKLPTYIPSATDSLEIISEYKFIPSLINEKLRINFKNIQDTLFRPIQISLLPFIGTNQLVSSNVINDLSFNIFAGISGGVRKAEFAGFVNINRWNVQGFQSAGFANFVGGNVTGFQNAGFCNFVIGNVKGFQNAGFSNINKGSFKGAQFAGFINANYGGLNGFQGAGAINTNYRNAKGVQAAGLTNINFSSVKGTQLAGLGNFAFGKQSSTQLAGLANFSYGIQKGLQVSTLLNVNLKELNGVQISSIFNFAIKVKRGFQLGLFNYADSSNAISAGLFSFVRKGGYRRLEIGSNEQGFIIGTIKTGVRRFYNIGQVGIWTQQTNRPIWLYGYGIGNSIFLKNNWIIDFQGTHAFLLNGKSSPESYQLPKFQITMEKKLGKNTSIAFGPVLNGLLEKNNKPEMDQLKGFIPYNLKQYNFKVYTLKTWIGFTASFRFFDSLGYGK